MPYLDIMSGHGKKRVSFSGEPLLSRVLEDNGFLLPHPCGGRGVCGKCAADVTGELSEMTEKEKALGVRLSCRTRLVGNASVTLPESREIRVAQSEPAAPKIPIKGKIGAAVDIGTTTVAAAVYDLLSGKELGRAGGANPQVSVAADVIGRISAALDGRLFEERDMALSALKSLLLRAYPSLPDVMVVTGNTAMLYLLTGRSPVSLAAAPFEADCLFGLWTEICGIRAYIPPCMNAFVGADITCAALYCGLACGGAALLCDVGTNSEIALWSGERLYVASSAAGPAFEGGIECGMTGADGAIDRVWLENGRIRFSVIGSVEPRGICGSGLLDALSAFLRLRLIDKTGFCDEERLYITEKVYISREDVRAAQLAKAAVAAGIRTLSEASGVPLSSVSAFSVAGGFGSRLYMPSAVSVGLVPREMQTRARAVGNAALGGAEMLLLDDTAVSRAERLASLSCHVQLGGNDVFGKYYMEEIGFPIY